MDVGEANHLARDQEFKVMHEGICRSSVYRLPKQCGHVCRMDASNQVKNHNSE